MSMLMHVTSHGSPHPIELMKSWLLCIDYYSIFVVLRMSIAGDNLGNFIVLTDLKS
jgi:predicted membrane channel-forming protein YqfA (hemolysin III family)